MTTPAPELVPYRLRVPDRDLDDLRDRLRRTRWAERETVDDWSQGIPLDYLRQLCAYWADGYDWRATERRLNAYQQVMATIDGLQIHVLHIRSRHEDAVPLLMTHGWPGSIIEFGDVIAPLTDPTAHGGDASDAFHLVLPSLPGYGFSGKPTAPGWGVERIADAWARLMPALGYERYAVQGGDWGSTVSASLATRHPKAVAGLHLLMPSIDLPSYAAAAGDDLDDADRAALASMRGYRKWERGYSAQQSTRPQTVGYGLVDSPVGLAGWIIEKFKAWTDCDGHPENVFTRDQLLDNLMFYWLPATGASSARLYWESFRQPARDPVTVPTGCSIFPRELLRPSRRMVQTRFTDLRYWNELTRGGHFAAFEQPAAFTGEVRAFFREIPR